MLEAYFNSLPVTFRIFDGDDCSGNLPYQLAEVEAARFWPKTQLRPEKPRPTWSMMAHDRPNEKECPAMSRPRKDLNVPTISRNEGYALT